MTLITADLQMDHPLPVVSMEPWPPNMFHSKDVIQAGDFMDVQGRLVVCIVLISCCCYMSMQFNRTR